MNAADRQTSTSTSEYHDLRESTLFRQLSPTAAEKFKTIKVDSLYLAGTLLFTENEPARGVYLIHSGKVKLSVSSRGGRMLILEMAGPGEMIGLSASMSGMPYEVSAETLHPSQVSFVLRQDFVRFVNCFPEVYHAVIRQINSQYAQACEQLRTVGLSTTAQEKLARLLLHWSSKDKQASASAHIKVPLTHEQIAECVGATRETVTRTLSEFKNKHLVRFNGSTIVIPSLAALQAISGD